MTVYAFVSRESMSFFRLIDLFKIIYIWYDYEQKAQIQP